jgi:hypothetical protein
MLDDLHVANDTIVIFTTAIALTCRPGPTPACLHSHGDKGFDTVDFVRECRNIWVTPRVAQNFGRRGGRAIDSRTTRQGAMQSARRRGNASKDVLAG